ncbi:MAG TPA: sulfite exporter TauE/SafE family protein [Polyangia bacterium]
MAEATIVEVVAVVFFATIFRTTFGFGEALVAVPLLALVIPIQVAAPIAVLASIVIAGYIVARDWRHIHLQSAGWLVASTLFGLPVGLLALKTVPEAIMKLVLAAIILAFSGYSLVRARRLSLADDRFAWLFGFCAGVFGGSYGMNGPPLAIYGSLRGWAPEKFRATLQGYFLPASVLGMCGYGAAGLWTVPMGRLFAWSLPAIALGIVAGRLLNRRLAAERFRRLLHGGLMLVAVVLVVQTYFVME